MRGVVAVLLVLSLSTFAGCLVGDDTAPEGTDADGAGGADDGGAGGAGTGDGAASGGSQGGTADGSGKVPVQAPEVEATTVTVERWRVNLTGAAGDAAFIWVPIENATEDELLRYGFAFEPQEGAEVLYVRPTLARTTSDGEVDPGGYFMGRNPGGADHTTSHTLRNHTTGLWMFVGADKPWTLRLLLRIDPALEGAAQPNSTIGTPVVSQHTGFRILTHTGAVAGAEPVGTVTMTEEVETSAMIHVEASSYASLVPAAATLRAFTVTYPSGRVIEEPGSACAYAVLIGQCTGRSSMRGGEFSSATGTFSLEMTHVETTSSFRVEVFIVPIDLTGLPAAFDGLRTG